MTGTLLPGGLTVRMEGDRTQRIHSDTRKMMEQFGLRTEEQNGVIRIPGGQKTCLQEYVIEPDVSGACYFYGMAPLLGIDVTVRGIHPDSMQGDLEISVCPERNGMPVGRYGDRNLCSWQPDAGIQRRDREHEGIL